MVLAATGRCCADPFAIMEALEGPPVVNAQGAPTAKPALDLNELYGLGAAVPPSGPSVGAFAGGPVPLMQQPLGFGAAPPRDIMSGTVDLMGTA
jgi:hypothetical protein